jgi:hypothetical protein
MNKLRICSKSFKRIEGFLFTICSFYSEDSDLYILFFHYVTVYVDDIIIRVISFMVSDFFIETFINI